MHSEYSKTDVEKYMKVLKFFVFSFLLFNYGWFLRFVLARHLIIDQNNVFIHHEGAQTSVNEEKDIEE